MQMRMTKSLYLLEEPLRFSVPLKCCPQLKYFSNIREVANLTKPALMFCIPILSKMLQKVNMSLLSYCSTLHNTATEDNEKGSFHNTLISKLF